MARRYLAKGADEEYLILKSYPKVVGKVVDISSERSMLRSSTILLPALIIKKYLELAVKGYKK